MFHINICQWEFQFSRLRPRLLKVSLSFETKTSKLPMVETETRIWAIFETVAALDRPLDVQIEDMTKSLVDQKPCSLGSERMVLWTLQTHTVLNGLCHNHTFYYHKILHCIHIHMEAIILDSTYVFENFRFWQIPKVNLSLKRRFPGKKWSWEWVSGHKILLRID